jgi:hypothetical protein
VIITINLKGCGLYWFSLCDHLKHYLFIYLFKFLF